MSQRYDKRVLPTPGTELVGRPDPLVVPEKHYVLGTPLSAPFAEGTHVAYFGMGCFWGVERAFWQIEGVHSTAAGYQGGQTLNPSYEEVCSGGTGHTEVVQVVFHPDRVGYEDLLKVFWENHDPTQGMRQGADIGTQYRSAIYAVDDRQLVLARRSQDGFQAVLSKGGFGEITTEITKAGPFYYAEEKHQQYLAKNPGGYCGIGGTGMSCPVGLVGAAE